jgi:molybdopterin/thiamine biosynthesis adenylyltransferase
MSILKNFTDKVFKIRESIDVYIINCGDSVKIQFYKINTREKISIMTNDDVAKFIANFDGMKSVKEIYDTLKLSNYLHEPTTLIEFMLAKNLIVENEILTNNQNSTSIRFIRQTSFFEDWLDVPDGEITQKKLEEKHIIIFGVGGIGSTIAILLARAGISHFTFVDHKKINISSQIRHFFFRNKYIGMYKTDALADYLLSLNASIKIELFHEKLLPETDLNIFVKDADFVINTADEPYIGYTNLKLGRYLWPLNIAMYATGGFDAHLMSTGEMIIPQKTPCIDCYINTFRKSLANWKPTYAEPVAHKVIEKSEDTRFFASGGLAQMGLFSASYAAIQIIQYLLGAPLSDEHMSKRGECLFNKAKLTWFHMGRQRDCNVCSK